MQYTNRILINIRLITFFLLLVFHFLPQPFWCIHKPGNYQLAMLMNFHLKPKNLIHQTHQCIQHQRLPGERQLSDLLLLGHSLALGLFWRMQDKYLPIRSAGLPFPGTLQTGSFPLPCQPKALLSIWHASITMLLTTFENGMLPLEWVLKHVVIPIYHSPSISTNLPFPPELHCCHFPEIPVNWSKTSDKMTLHTLAMCYEWVHHTTWLKVGCQRGFRQWLQLVCCANLLLWVQVFL